MALGDPEGFGATTTGGAGGPVYHVTNVLDSNQDNSVKAPDGSLRYFFTPTVEAIANGVTTGPRQIVFDDNGSGEPIKIRRPLNTNFGTLTCDALTAPNPVILTGEETRIQNSDVILQGIRFRPGDQWPARDGFQNRDVLNFGHPDPLVETANVLVRFCSFSWGVDECVAVQLLNTHDITVQNCIIAEGLRNSKHPEGQHSMGFLVQGNQMAGMDRNVSFHHNLVVSCGSRNPQASGCAVFDVRNNVIVNWGDQSFEVTSNTYAVYPFQTLNKINCVGNLWIPGLSTNKQRLYEMILSLPKTTVQAEIYLAENRGPVMVPGGDQWRGVIHADRRAALFEEYGVATPHPAPAVTTICADQSYDYLVKARGCGASLPEYDATDLRIFEEVETRKATIKDHPPEDLWPEI